MKQHITLLLALLCSQLSLGQAANSQLPTANYYSGPIIDMHAHAYVPEDPFLRMLGKEEYLPLIDSTFTAAASLEVLQAETMQLYKEHKVVKAMIMRGDLWKEAYPDLVITGNAGNKSVEELRESIQSGITQVIGEMAPHYSGKSPGDPEVIAYLDLAEEFDIPVGFHLYPGGPPGGAYFAYPLTRARQAKPLQLEDLLFERRNMRIYIMHGGWPFLEDMKALMFAHPQVYVDISVINWIIPRAEFHDFLQGLVKAGFGKRIMFGIDHMIWPQAIPLAIENVQSADFLTAEQKADIFFHNAVRFLESKGGSAHRAVPGKP